MKFDLKDVQRGLSTVKQAVDRVRQETDVVRAFTQGGTALVWAHLTLLDKVSVTWTRLWRGTQAATIKSVQLAIDNVRSGRLACKRQLIQKKMTR